jgi:hypothetical protein
MQGEAREPVKAKNGIFFIRLNVLSVYNCKKKKKL